MFLYDSLIDTLQLQHKLLAELIGLVALRIARDGDISGLDRIKLEDYQKQALELESRIQQVELKNIKYGELLLEQSNLGTELVVLDFKILHAKLDSEDTSAFLARKQEIYTRYNELDKQLGDMDKSKIERE